MAHSHNKILPVHIAIIMDGNGRWAKERGLPRAAGHKSGINTLRDIVGHCTAKGIKALTVYAFSSENWRRPDEEVGLLMELFIRALKDEVAELHENQVQIRFIGELSRFPEKLQQSISTAESLTSENSGLTLSIAANYGGRWDICNAFQSVYRDIQEGNISASDVDEECLRKALTLSDLPEVDLFIRTGGERRISNYLLWQLAYTEMYFTDTYWPDFSIEQLDKAFEWFGKRQRRFGRTSEQIETVKRA